jgi:hypothetical protein
MNSSAEVCEPVRSKFRWVHGTKQEQCIYLIYKENPEFVSSGPSGCYVWDPPGLFDDDF